MIARFHCMDVFYTQNQSTRSIYTLAIEVSLLVSAYAFHLASRPKSLTDYSITKVPMLLTVCTTIISFRPEPEPGL